MKQLVLVRHGKSSWDFPVKDISRPLKKRGIVDGEYMARAFLPYVQPSVKLYTSIAKRAEKTAGIFKEILGIADKDFGRMPELYTFDAPPILKFVEKQNDAIQQIILFGHNPALTLLTNYWGNKCIDNLPTTGIVLLKFKEDHWCNIASGNTEIIMCPKAYRTRNSVRLNNK